MSRTSTGKMKDPATNVALFVISPIQFDTSLFDLYKRNF